MFFLKYKFYKKKYENHNAINCISELGLVTFEEKNYFDFSEFKDEPLQLEVSILLCLGVTGVDRMTE